MPEGHTLHRLATELSTAFAPCEFRVKWADGGWEINEARKLRRAVFCVEQGLFGGGDDLDAIDVDAQPLVALSCVGGINDQVVGTVRIHEVEPGLWWGSRLAVHAAFRKHGRLGAGLIQLAVASANGRGAHTFLAHVQSQNAPLFHALHWTTLSEEMMHGRPHYLMQAGLDFYPPCVTPHSGFVTQYASARSAI